MKGFLRNIFVFSLLIIVPLVLAEVYVRSLPNPSRYKHEWMLRHSGEVETLVLGSSHTFYGISPSLLGEGAFSLAQPSQTYRYDYYLLTRYNMPRLKTVILPFSYTSLFEDIEAEKTLHPWAVRYRLYMDCDIHSPLSEYGFEFMHISAFKEKLGSLFRPARLSWDSQGYGTSYGEQSLLAEGKGDAKARVEQCTYPEMKSLAFCTAILDSICSFCEKRDISLLLVSTPLSKEFLRRRSNRQVAVADSTLRRVMERHPSVRYQDYRTDTTFHVTDFYDFDHLNMIGAAKLTRKVREQVGR